MSFVYPTLVGSRYTGTHLSKLNAAQELAPFQEG